MLAVINCVKKRLKIVKKDLEVKKKVVPLHSHFEKRVAVKAKSSYKDWR